MMSYSVNLPDDFGDYEWEIEAKGWFPVPINVCDKMYTLNFYDPVRLGQEARDELLEQDAFMEKNLIVVKIVNRLNIEAAVESLVRSDRVNFLTPD